MSPLNLFAALLLVAPTADRPDLAGRVVAEGGGPVAGAHVFIATAAPRRGTSPLCPSCYADCGKRAVTGDDGTFAIDDLDPELIFRVLVIAEGHRPAFVPGVDPMAGPMEATLEPFDLDALDPSRYVRGRVVGPDGAPAVGSTVEPMMFDTEAFRGFSPDIFDPLAVTDLDGMFVLTATSPIRRVDVRAEGRGLAPRVFRDLAPGASHTLRMTEGAEVTGRVLNDGEPVPGVEVGLVQVSRSSGEFLGPSRIGTDAEGRFRFTSVGPDERYFVYGLMDSLKGTGAVAAREVVVGGDGTVVDAGDLAVVPGRRLAGRVVLSDGKPIPAGTRLMVSREQAWDSQRVALDAEGRFELTGLPPEEYSVSVRVPGYELSPRNKTIDPLNPYRLVGYVEEDFEGLTILLEPEGDD